MQKLLPQYRKFLPHAAIILCLLVALWVIFAPHYGMIAYYRANKELQDTKTKNQALVEENKSLQDELDKLKNDPEYIEELARKQFGLIKKNEVLYDFSKKR